MPAEAISTADVPINTALVRRLIAAQFPEWAPLPVKPVAFGGWDNRTFHLGERMTVRLPSAARYAEQVEKEQGWLPRLAPLLPLPIPVPLAMGRPAAVNHQCSGQTMRMSQVPQTATRMESGSPSRQ